jgi:hypothetical protein
VLTLDHEVNVIWHERVRMICEPMVLRKFTKPHQ